MKKEVIIYTKTRCPFCARLMNMLNERGIKFKEIDFIKNPEYVERIVTREGNIPAPQVEMSGKIVFDYTTEEDLASEIEDYVKN